MKYRFLADYRHRWPSRAHTEYKAGMVMTLKREVVDYALPRGLIEPVVGGYVGAPLAMTGNGDPERLMPSKRRKLRITDGK